MGLKDFYNDNLKHWEKFPRTSVREQYLELLNLPKMVSDKESVSILDVGAGTGMDEKIISNTFESLGYSNYSGVGVDFSETAITEAKKKNNNHWEFMNVDFFNDSNVLTGKRFDIAICSMVVMHYKDLNHIFETISNHLKPNGKLLLVTNNPYLVCHEYNMAYKNKLEYEHKFNVSTDDGSLSVAKYLHTLPSYINSAKENQLSLDTYKEILFYGDEAGMYNDKNNNELEYPNFIAFVFSKK